jgi:hypothetical protein
MRIRFPNAAAVVVLFALVVPASAAAAAGGSIVYSKSGNIYRAHGDGSHATRLTHDGTRSHPYTHPTQADDGTIVAVRNDTTLYRFTRTGKHLGKAHKVATGLTNPRSLHDLIFSPAVSPNGREVAVQNTLLEGTYDPNSGSHGMTLVAIVIQYRSAKTGRKLRELHVPGDYLESPSWIDNNHILFFKPLAGYTEQVHVNTRGDGSRGWFADELGGDPAFDRPPLDEGEITRAQDKLALIRGTNLKSDWHGSTIVIYRTSGTSQMPEVACTITHRASGPFAKPTWSPDGSTLAWSEGSSIYRSPVNTSVAGCGLSPTRIVKGGVTPDWGPKA